MSRRRGLLIRVWQTGTTGYLDGSSISSRPQLKGTVVSTCNRYRAVDERWGRTLLLMHIYFFFCRLQSRGASVWLPWQFLHQHKSHWSQGHTTKCLAPLKIYFIIFISLLSWISCSGQNNIFVFVILHQTSFHSDLKTYLLQIISLWLSMQQEG